MTGERIRAIEENTFACYGGIARWLGGQFTEEEQVAWFFTGRRSLYRFNGVLRTVTRKEELSRVVDPILHVFLSQSLPFFWADWPDAGTPGWPEYLSSKRIPFVRMNAIPAMARKLDSLPQASLSKEVEIIRVETNGIKMTG